MNRWIMIFWIASTLMACWGFSLFVRLVSETIARKRNRLAAKYSKRAGWAALGIMIACLIVSAVFGYIAVDLEEQFSWSGNYKINSGINSATVIGWTMGLFGVFLVIWWVVGDRARGRTRCPKCWYDMSDAVGLQCPECGKTATNKLKFLKARRPRWMVLLALMLMGGGWYGVLVGPRVMETKEWLAVVPTWVLMTGWDVLPEEWVYDSGRSPVIYDSRLEERLKNSNQTINISWKRKNQFGNKLLNGMLHSKRARWDDKRITLIIRVENALTNTLSGSDQLRVIPRATEQLFTLSAKDIIEMLIEENPSIGHEKFLEDMVYQSWGSYNIDAPLYMLLQRWIWNDTRDRSADEGQVLTQQRYRELLIPNMGILRSDRFIKNLGSKDYYRSKISQIIAVDAGLALDYMDDYLVYRDKDRFQQTLIDARDLGHSYAWASEDEKSRLLQACNTLIDSGIAWKQSLSFFLFDSIQRSGNLNAKSVDTNYLETYNAFFQFELKKDSDFIGLNNYSFQSIRMKIISNHDVTGQTLFPLIREQLQQHPKTAWPIDFWSMEMDPVHIRYWLNNFSDFIESDNPDIHEWIITNTPIATGTPYDDIINQIVLNYINDGDLDQYARFALRARNAEHLLPENTDP